ncbi:hypothetical protein HYDPIDRAFT_120537 [Hydnomerulius pinastri MD-312]|uniref:C3H1-type domain-containing protein n=1 Tax=Hydnomerulius pinastri MD-312 TaxID=994086 RepID=A0A0C2PGE1_9AGAM|nr:hypothetical protein HYDPIDRAFT_120537 [Hydnomerulius pinastri MD-312]
MTENASSSSQTFSSGENPVPSVNESCVRNSLAAVESYRKGKISKVDSVLQIRAAFAPTAVGNGELDKSAFLAYLDILDEIDADNRRAQSRGATLDVRRSSSRDTGQGGEHDELDEPLRRAERGNKGKGRRIESDEEDEEEGDLPIVKRKRPSVNEALFPWGPASIVLRNALAPDLREIFTLLEDWANDPTYVVRKILLSPGCPDFPPDQWANIVKGLAVDLDKVLGAHYSTEVETKQSQDVGDLFQIAIKVPKQSKAVKTHGDWIIAFGKTVQATTFALPQRATEYTAWLSYMSQLFASIRSPFHDRIIEFDKAVRLRVANQKHIRLNDFAQFDDLRTIYLSSYGMGPNSPERSSGKGRRVEKGSSNAGQREPCHKWNRGTCDKSAAECKYDHCCDRRNCRGSHRRSECSTA